MIFYQKFLFAIWITFSQFHVEFTNMHLRMLGKRVRKFLTFIVAICICLSLIQILKDCRRFDVELTSFSNKKKLLITKLSNSFFPLLF